LQYRLVKGDVIVYSVGADGDDDGGRTPVDAVGRPAPHLATPWVGPRQPRDGDWVLWPPPQP
jgi:hypothetical protein